MEIVPDSTLREQCSIYLYPLLILFLSSLMVAVPITYFVARGYTRRLDRLVHSVTSVQSGNFSVQVKVGFPDEVGQLENTFNYMTKELNKLMQQQYENGRAVRRAQYKALQAQINPHFLYNTLDLVNWSAIGHNAPEISELVCSLASFYRLSLNNGKTITTIRRELEHVHQYLHIETFHYPEILTYSFNVEEQVQEFICPSIILQPLVENAIVHGLNEHADMKSLHINITAKVDKKDIVITVQDNGFGISPENLEGILHTDKSKQNHGYGVSNIQSRLQVAFGTSYGLSYESQIGKGTIVTVRIPQILPENIDQIEL